jgi:hypothetical protein
MWNGTVIINIMKDTTVNAAASSSALFFVNSGLTIYDRPLSLSHRLLTEYYSAN